MNNYSKLIAVIALAVTVVMYFIKNSQKEVIDNLGNKTSYVTGGFFDNKVYYKFYSGDGFGGQHHYKALEGVSKKTFKAYSLRLEIDKTLTFGKHGSTFYLFSHKIPVNPEEEMIIKYYGSNTGADILVSESGVYYGSLHIPWKKASPVDPKSFSSRGSYFFDKKSLFYRGVGSKFVKIEGVTPENIEALSWDFLKTKKVVLFEGKIVLGAKSEKFENLKGTDLDYFATDEENIFYKEKKLEGFNKKNMVVVGSFPSFDTTVVHNGELVYFKGEVLENIDIRTIKIDRKKETISDKSGIKYKLDDNLNLVLVEKK